MKLHIVKTGETLAALTDKYGVGLEELSAANPQIQAADPLAPGSKVKIPAGKVTIQGFPEEAAPAHRNEPEAAVIAAENPAVNAAAAAAADNKAPDTAFENAVKPLGDSNGPALADNLQPMPIEGYPGVVGPGAASKPTAFKTDLSDTAYSPLNVKLTPGKEEAVPPYASFPTQAYEAGAYTGAYPSHHSHHYGYQGHGAQAFAVPQQAVPAAYGGYGQPEAYSAFGAQGAHHPYGVYGQPAFPVQPFGAPFEPGVSPYIYGANPYMTMPDTRQSGECGCGGSGRQRLPYALPLGSAAGVQQPAQGQSQAGVSGFPFADEAFGAISPVQGQGSEAEEPKAMPKAKQKRKLRAPASRTDAVKAFVKRTKGRRKQPKLGSRPWVQTLY